jgi:hypothetical protein
MQCSIGRGSRGWSGRGHGGFSFFSILLFLCSRGDYATAGAAATAKTAAEGGNVHRRRLRLAVLYVAAAAAAKV